MTEKDETDLSFVAEYADAVELSFANTSQHVQMLQQRLAELEIELPAIVLKIETRRGFDNLPDMLLTAMKSPCCGVMIARGDLAVECVMLNKGPHIVTAVRVLDDILRRMQSHQSKKEQCVVDCALFIRFPVNSGQEVSHYSGAR